MPVHLMGPSPLHLNLMQGTLQAAGWQAADIQTPASRSVLESALAQQPQALLVLDLGGGEDLSSLLWLAETTRRWPSLQAVLLCSQRSETLLMQAMRSGARAVLDSPPEPVELVQTLQRLTPAAASAESGDAPLAPVLAFIASKGGCGSTLLASNLAWVLATDFERETLLIDLDRLYADASFYLGGGQARHSLDSITQQPARLDRQLLRSSLHPVHARLNLLAAPSVPQSAQTLPAPTLARLFSLARQTHQTVVLDLPHQPDASTLAALELADVVFIVLRQQVPDVRNARRLIELLQAQGLPMARLHPLVNCAGEAGGLDADAVAKALPMPVRWRVGNDPAAMQACAHLGLPLHQQAPGSPVLRDLRQIASLQLNLPLPRRSGWFERWRQATQRSAST